jgi:two-component system, OmpR family, sensor histidine kinase KdpD
MPKRRIIWLNRLEQYFLSILMVAVMTTILKVFEGSLSIQTISLIFLLPVVVSTTTWGFGAGVLSAFFTFSSFNYFFILPLYTFSVHSPQDLLGLIIYLVVAVVISRLLGSAQAGTAAATAREGEAIRLYELSMALVGLQDDQAILTVLTEKIREAFNTQAVEIHLTPHPSPGLPKPEAPGSGLPGGITPDATASLATARGELGMILLWRHEAPLSKAESRLLSTFASQGALAIERARLVQNENKAILLEESDRLKSALLSSVSHELRSPLATIKASVTGLHGGTVDWDTEARQDLLAVIEEETDHLNLLVGNLLDMTRLETGALKPLRKWNSMREIVNGVVKRMRLTVQKHQIKVSIPSDLPLAPVDYVQMEQVFTNLISNSAKYAPPGTVIEIQAGTRPDQTLLVQVRNQGPAVPAEHLERIFDKFYRITAADKVTGTGLGLSICKGIIEAHGGRIWAENAPGWFVFNFTLPLTWDGALPQSPREA